MQYDTLVPNYSSGGSFFENKTKSELNYYEQREQKFFKNFLKWNLFDLEQDVKIFQTFFKTLPNLPGQHTEDLISHSILYIIYFCYLTLAAGDGGSKD